LLHVELALAFYFVTALFTSLFENMKDGETPLYCGVMKLSVDIVFTLIRFGADVNIADKVGSYIYYYESQNPKT
jgi:hypothetical protein